MYVMRSVLQAALILAGLTTAYWLVDDDKRPVVTTKGRIFAERLDAIQAAIRATPPRRCTWRDIMEIQK